MDPNDHMIGKRVEQILASIKSDWKGAGLIDQEYHFPATAERIIEEHIRAAIVVGMETSIDDLIHEIKSIRGQILDE